MIRYVLSDKIIKSQNLIATGSGASRKNIKYEIQTLIIFLLSQIECIWLLTLLVFIHYIH